MEKEISNLPLKRKDEEIRWRKGYEDGDDSLEDLCGYHQAPRHACGGYVKDGRMEE